MPGDLLGGPRKAAFTVISQILNGYIVGTADRKRTAVQMQNGELIEPFSRPGRIERFRPFENIHKNIFYFLGCHTTVPYEAMSL
jgi:hypothetical protein